MNKNFLKVLKLIRYSIIVLMLVAMTAALIYAQPNTNGNANGRVDRGNDRTETRVVERDNDFDWGWLGLLGLLGLAGLIPKRRKVEVQEFRDTNQPPTGAR